MLSAACAPAPGGSACRPSARRGTRSIRKRPTPVARKLVIAGGDARREITLRTSRGLYIQGRIEVPDDRLFPPESSSPSVILIAHSSLLGGGLTGQPERDGSFALGPLTDEVYTIETFSARYDPDRAAAREGQRQAARDPPAARRAHRGPRSRRGQRPGPRLRRRPDPRRRDAARDARLERQRRQLRLRGPRGRGVRRQRLRLGRTRRNQRAAAPGGGSGARRRRPAARDARRLRPAARRARGRGRERARDACGRTACAWASSSSTGRRC
jgi:hypothetical protein